MQLDAKSKAQKRIGMETATESRATMLQCPSASCWLLDSTPRLTGREIGGSRCARKLPSSGNVQAGVDVDDGQARNSETDVPAPRNLRGKVRVIQLTRATELLLAAEPAPEQQAARCKMQDARTHSSARSWAKAGLRAEAEKLGRTEKRTTLDDEIRIETREMHWAACCPGLAVLYCAFPGIPPPSTCSNPIDGLAARPGGRGQGSKATASQALSGSWLFLTPAQC